MCQSAVHASCLRLATLHASAMRVRPRLSPSARRLAMRIRGSAAVSPVRRWVKQCEQRPLRHDFTLNTVAIRLCADVSDEFELGELFAERTQGRTDPDD